MRRVTELHSASLPCRLGADGGTRERTGGQAGADRGGKVPTHSSAGCADTAEVSEGRGWAGIKILGSLVALWITDGTKWELTSFCCC